MALLGLYVISAGGTISRSGWPAFPHPCMILLDWLIGPAAAAVTEAAPASRLAAGLSAVAVPGPRALFWHAAADPGSTLALSSATTGSGLQAPDAPDRQAGADRWRALCRNPHRFHRPFQAGMVKRWHTVTNGALLAALGGVRADLLGHRGHGGWSTGWGIQAWVGVSGADRAAGPDMEGAGGGAECAVRRAGASAGGLLVSRAAIPRILPPGFICRVCARGRPYDGGGRSTGLKLAATTHDGLPAPEIPTRIVQRPTGSSMKACNRQRPPRQRLVNSPGADRRDAPAVADLHGDLAGQRQRHSAAPAHRSGHTASASCAADLVAPHLQPQIDQRPVGQRR